MNVRPYLAAFWADWIGLMSGIGSVALAFWAALFPPQTVQSARGLLFLSSVVCFIVTSYRIWNREYERRLSFEEVYCKPRVSIDHQPNEPGFVASTAIQGKHYRILRVRVLNIGGESLHRLRAQIRFATSHHSFSNIDLTLKEEDLPIIQHHIVRRDDRVLPKPQTSFSLERGEEQFVNVAMQQNVDGKWDRVEWCLSHIGSDNYNNIVNVSAPIEFSVIVIGGIHPDCSERFTLFLDDAGVLQLNQSDASETKSH